MDGRLSAPGSAESDPDPLAMARHSTSLVDGLSASAESIPDPSAPARPSTTGLSLAVESGLGLMEETLSTTSLAESGLSTTNSAESSLGLAESGLSTTSSAESSLGSMEKALPATCLTKSSLGLVETVSTTSSAERSLATATPSVKGCHPLNSGVAMLAVLILAAYHPESTLLTTLATPTKGSSLESLAYSPGPPRSLANHPVAPTAAAVRLSRPRLH